MWGTGRRISEMSSAHVSDLSAAVLWINVVTSRELRAVNGGVPIRS